MRSESQIKQKLKQVSYRHLQKRLRANFKQVAKRCCHNTPLLLDEDKGAWLGMCGILEGGLSRGVCDATVDGNQRARDCPLWEPLQTKAQVKQTFNDLMESGRGEVALEFPDVAALMWVLDAPETGSLILAEDEEADLEKPETWWRSLWNKLGVTNE